MPGSHVLVQALDSIRTAKVTEFLVHVVRSRSRIITDPDTKVLDFQRLLLMNLPRRRKKSKGCETRKKSPIVSNPISACLLKAAKGYQKDTYDVNTNDFAIGLLNLFELPG